MGIQKQKQWKKCSNRFSTYQTDMRDTALLQIINPLNSPPAGREIKRIVLEKRYIQRVKQFLIPHANYQ